MASARPAVKTSRRPKGPRPKHVPQRTCVACREQSAKRALTRIVRTTEGTVEIDPTGKRNGRGAYLCDRRDCWERGLAKGILVKALNVEISPSARETIMRHAATLTTESESVGAAAEGEQTHERE
ncbi:MAG: YlxR family protein [Chloroflexota bacterium]|nr:YlxR family protein [Chloroflexota bacterium]